MLVGAGLQGGFVPDTVQAGRPAIVVPPLSIARYAWGPPREQSDRSCVARHRRREIQEKKEQHGQIRARPHTPIGQRR